MTCEENRIKLFLASKVRGAEIGRIQKTLLRGERNYIYAIEDTQTYRHLNPEFRRDEYLKIY